jgi:hypothetical protein
LTTLVRNRSLGNDALGQERESAASVWEYDLNIGELGLRLFEPDVGNGSSGLEGVLDCGRGDIEQLWLWTWICWVDKDRGFSSIQFRHNWFERWVSKIDPVGVAKEPDSGEFQLVQTVLRNITLDGVKLTVESSWSTYRNFLDTIVNVGE